MNKYDLTTLLKQRRVWAALLSVIAVLAVSFDQANIAQMCTLLAGALGLDSYIRPKPANVN